MSLLLDVIFFSVFLSMPYKLLGEQGKLMNAYGSVKKEEFTFSIGIYFSAKNNFSVRQL